MPDSTDEEVIDVLLPVEDLRREVVELQEKNKRQDDYIVDLNHECDQYQSKLTDVWAELKELRVDRDALHTVYLNTTEELQMQCAEAEELRTDNIQLQLERDAALAFLTRHHGSSSAGCGVCGWPVEGA